MPNLFRVRVQRDDSVFMCLITGALAIMVCCLALDLPLEAQTLSVLHTFTGNSTSTSDGAGASGGLLKVGTILYGTTGGGGKGSCSSGGVSGCGTVYKMSLSGGSYTLLYSFKGHSSSDASGPGYGTMITDGKGNSYGTSTVGGTGPCKNANGVVVGCGTVFKITTAGKESVLYSFQGPPKDGWAPFSGLVRDTQGNLYGTTTAGGNKTCADKAPFKGCGTVFKITPAGVETVLYNFKGGTDGQLPVGVLVIDAAGNLYGTTLTGGSAKAGTIFKVTSTGAETILYTFSFAQVMNGVSPAGGLALDKSNGLLYGTTESGGMLINNTYPGVLFSEPTSGGTPTVLHFFTGGTTDGFLPFAAPTLDSKGNVYGTTQLGGTSDQGVVFELEANGMYKILVNLNGTNDGNTPQAALAVDSVGNLYGTAEFGGDASCTTGSGNPPGCGTAFKVTP